MTNIWKKSKLPAEHQNIISEWKKAVTDGFIVERHLKKGSILISTQNEVYQVCGITLSFEEILNMPLPVLLKTTLIPFKDVIIYDGLAEEKHVETIEWQYTDKQFNGCKVMSEFIENFILAMRKNGISDEKINKILKYMNE